MTQHITKFENSPPPGGPYSLAVVAEGKFIYIAGQGPWNPFTEKWERGTIAEQTRLTLDNIKRVIEAAGGKMENAVSARVFLQPITEETFAEMNAVYGKYWGENKPTRTTIGAQLLGLDVEIDCVVLLDE